MLYTYLYISYQEGTGSVRLVSCPWPRWKLCAYRELPKVSLRWGRPADAKTNLIGRTFRARSPPPGLCRHPPPARWGRGRAEPEGQAYYSV